MSSTSKRCAARALVAGLGLVLMLVGCGSSNSGPSGASGTDGGGGTSGSGSAGCSAMSWFDDGVSQCADLLAITRSTKNGFDQLAVVGSQTSNVGLALKVIVPGGGAIETGKEYACDGAYILFVYQAGTLPSHTTKSCTITVSALGGVGTPASGAFSAMLLASDGTTTKQIAQGAFSAVPTIAN